VRNGSGSPERVVTWTCTVIIGYPKAARALHDPGQRKQPGPTRSDTQTLQIDVPAAVPTLFGTSNGNVRYRA
jgi:hypothetical protein